MKLVQWFKDRIGKKVVLSTEDGNHTVKVKDVTHAEHLYRMQTPATSYRYQEEHEDDYVTPVVATLLLSEMLSSDSGSSGDITGNYSSDIQDTPIDHDVMTGGDFGGGGASGSWDSGSSSSSDYSSSSDSSSYDSGSSSYDSGSSSYDSGGSNFDSSSF